VIGDTDYASETAELNPSAVLLTRDRLSAWPTRRPPRSCPCSDRPLGRPENQCGGRSGVINLRPPLSFCAAGSPSATRGHTRGAGGHGPAAADEQLGAERPSSARSRSRSFGRDHSRGRLCHTPLASGDLRSLRRGHRRRRMGATFDLSANVQLLQRHTAPARRVPQPSTSNCGWQLVATGHGRTTAAAAGLTTIVRRGVQVHRGRGGTGSRFRDVMASDSESIPGSDERGGPGWPGPG